MADKKESKARKPGRRLPWWKKALFSVIMAALFFGLLELVLLVVGVKPLLYEDDPYVGFAGSIPLFVEDGKQMVTARNKIKWFNEQQFPAKKGSKTRRIFCMGGSTTYGRPFFDDTSFCGWLREYLPAADPSQSWEVINAGGISYASYRIAALMEELDEYDPDLFIIYCGQNEFLEDRTYGELMEMPAAVRGLQANLSKSRTYSLLSRVVKGRPTPKKSTKLGAEVSTMLDTVGTEAYTRDPDWQEKVMAHYRFNLARMVDIARAAGAEVVFVMPASNLRNSSPFKSEQRAGLSEEDRASWEKLYQDARTKYENGEYAQASADAARALEIDDQHAHLHYLHGRILDALKDPAEAKAAYDLAVENDICPLRMPAKMRPILQEVADERGVLVVDFHALAEARSKDGIPGEDLFLDHVHPTIESHRLLALALIEDFEKQGTLTRSDSWNDEVVERIKAKVMAGVDDHRRGIAMRNLANVLKWARKYEDAYAAAKKSLELSPGDAYANFVMAELAEKLGKKDEAMKHYKFMADFKLDYKEAPYLMEVPYNYAILLAERAEYAECVRMLRKTLQLKPDHKGARDALPLALQNLGAQYTHSGKGELAIAPLEELIMMKPGDPSAHNLLGIALVQAGRPKDAIPQFLTVLKKYTEDPGTHNNLATAYAQIGEKEKAVTHFRETVRINPAHVGALGNLGELYFSAGQSEEAAKYFNRVLELQPDHAAAKARLAQIRERGANP